MKLYALDGKVYEAVKVGEGPYADAVHADGTCLGCGEPSGEDHAPGCDWERCPRCLGQFGNCHCDYHEERPAYAEGDARDIVAALTRALMANAEPVDAQDGGG